MGTAGGWDGEWLRSWVEIIVEVLAFLLGGRLMCAYFIVKNI